MLAKRVAKGTFSRNPKEYRKEFLTAVGLGRTIVREVKSKGWHLLLVTDHPMKGTARSVPTKTSPSGDRPSCSARKCSSRKSAAP